MAERAEPGRSGPGGARGAAGPGTGLPADGLAAAASASASGNGWAADVLSPGLPGQPDGASVEEGAGGAGAFGVLRGLRGFRWSGGPAEVDAADGPPGSDDSGGAGDGGGAATPPPPRLRLSRRGIAVLTALGALVAVLAVWLVWFSSVFDVRTVSVSGTRELTRQQVLAAARVPLGGPLERLDTGAVAARVRAALPRAERVRVDTSFPHTVTIAVTERTAVAALRVPGGYAQVDATGVRFATAPTAPHGVPVLSLELSPAGRAALRVYPEQVLLRGAVQVATALPAKVAGRTRALVVHSYDDMELSLAGGDTVWWGSPERSARKAQVLTALLTRPGSGYDVSAPDDPAVRP